MKGILFSVEEELQLKEFPTRSYKPADFNTKNSLLQVLVTDTLRSNNIIFPLNFNKQNQAIIVYTFTKTNKYYYPIKTINFDRINFP